MSYRGVLKSHQGTRPWLLSQTALRATTFVAVAMIPRISATYPLLVGVLALFVLGVAACSSSCGIKATSKESAVASIDATGRNGAGSPPVDRRGADDVGGRGDPRDDGGAGNAGEGGGKDSAPGIATASENATDTMPLRAILVGSHTLVDQAPGQGTSPMTTNPITTQRSGSSFVVCAGIGTNYGKPVNVSISDNMGNPYRQVGSNVLYAGDQGTTSLYVCTSCAGGENHRFSMTKQRGFTDYESTMFVVEIQGATAVDGYVQANAQSSPLSAGSVKTTKAGDALIMCAFAASYSAPDNYTPSAGYTLLDQQTVGTVAMAGASAVRLAKAPGSYGGTMTSSLAGSGAIFLIALGP